MISYCWINEDVCRSGLMEVRAEWVRVSRGNQQRLEWHMWTIYHGNVFNSCAVAFTNEMWAAEKSEKFTEEFNWQRTQRGNLDPGKHCLMLESNFVCDGFTFLPHLQYKDASSRCAVGLLCVRRLFSWICEEIWNNLFLQIILLSCQEAYTV